jgi:hypothetical protein
VWRLRNSVPARYLPWKGQLTVQPRFYRLNSNAGIPAGAARAAIAGVDRRRERGISGGLRSIAAPNGPGGTAGRLATLALIALLAGCAGPAALSPSATAEQKQKAVAERAEARWAALIKGDLDAAYTYLSPTTRSTVTLAQFKGRIKPGIWKEAKAEIVKCDGDVCNVEMQITYDMPKMKGIRTPLAETWIIENGTPWYVYR